MGISRALSFPWIAISVIDILSIDIDTKVTGSDICHSTSMLGVDDERAYSYIVLHGLSSSFT